MKKEEAMRKYSIPIPEDFENYNKEDYREFDNMYLESFYATFFDPNSKKSRISEDRKKVAIVLGGQAGAGKSSLVADAKRKFEEKGGRIVVIDDDSYRKFYPYCKEILENCPEFYTDITATATNIITPKMIKFASDNGYNFIFEVTMKNNRIVNTMKTWEDYDIYVHVMAASGERSLMSTALRNGELRKSKNEGRVVDQQVHWDMYEGLPKTLEYIESEEPDLIKEIKIYTRSHNPLYPKEEYSSLKSEGKTSREKLEELRQIDMRKFLKFELQDNIDYLRELIVNLSDEEKKEAEEIIEFVQKSAQKLQSEEKQNKEER